LRARFCSKNPTATSVLVRHKCPEFGVCNLNERHMFKLVPHDHHREIMPRAGLYSLLLVAGLLTQHSNVVENKIISSGNKVSASDMFEHIGSKINISMVNGSNKQ
jgi:hypothetical protein